MTAIPTNIIYTGVAGTGKTYQLLQLAKQYTDYLPALDKDELIEQLLYEKSWRDVICLIFLDLKHQQQELVKVPEITVHEFFVAKAAQNDRDKNLSNTAWSVLQMHSAPHSQTVTYKHRASQAYFDKDESGAWYLLADSLPLLTGLSEQLTEFRQAQTEARPKHNRRFSLVSFHQAYGYEEFVEGIRPVIVNDNQSPRDPSRASSMRYDIQDGAFLQLCQRALSDPGQRYAMLIDEINRGNVARVFGELLSLIEPDKRSGQAQAMAVSLAYSGRAFSVPANVDIYATMNTQDHSLAPLDMALRRRFRFIDCPPRPDLLPVIEMPDTAKIGNESSDESIDESIDLAAVLTGLNQRISQSLGQEAQLGHAFFMSVTNLAQLQSVLAEQVIPQLAQAAGAQLDILQYLFNDSEQPFAEQFIQDSQQALEHSLDSLSRPRSATRDHNAHTATQAREALFNSSLLAAIPASIPFSPAGIGERFVINPDLIARVGAFNQPSVYQRLYPYYSHNSGRL